MSTANTPLKILVTGATGFLGHHLVDLLATEGHSVVALCRDPDSEIAQSFDSAVASRIRRVRGDILDPPSISAAAQGCTIVMHCAGMVSRDPNDATRMHEVNVLGTRNVLQACTAAGVRRLIHASTSGVIGISAEPDTIATEEQEPPIELINRWPYYRTKLYAERLALEYNGDDLEVVVVNPALLLGPGDYHGSSTEDVRRALEERVPLATAGGVSFVDARDAALGMMLAMQKGRPGHRYLLAACNCTIRTFLDRIARVAGTAPPIFALPHSDAIRRGTVWLTRAANRWLGEDDALPDPYSVDMAQHYWYVDASRAERELGWSARDPMLTLADTVADLRTRGLVMMGTST